MHVAFVPARVEAQRIKKQFVIVRSEEGHLPVYASDQDVLGQSGDEKAGLSGQWITPASNARIVVWSARASQPEKMRFDPRKEKAGPIAGTGMLDW